ncbi:MAG: aryl-alcohol dehydrogenase-like predicted oxidoreductase [Maribacter sp.]|jgi:aryl-alcohol dehydrogenase-like predicted oxidoreductase
MKYSQLGNTDIQVSKICLGTMTFGEQNTEAEGHEQLDYALERGVNFIDTAEMYSVPGRAETQGNTERIIGTWINARKNRDKYILATKVTGPSEGMSYIRNPLNFSKEQIRIAIEGSLKRLQTDYVDLYQLHWPERKTNFFSTLGYVYDENDSWEDNFLEIIQTMEELVKEGKIRHFGISNETAWGMMRFQQIAEKYDLPKSMTIQNAYSLLNRSFEVGCAEVAIREKMGLLSYSPMAFGMLSGKYHKANRNELTYRINKYKQYARYSNEKSFEATQKYLDIAEKYNLSLAQMSLAFINSRAFLTANIIGATTMQQLKENIDSINVELNPEIFKEIEVVHNEISNPAP